MKTLIITVGTRQVGWYCQDGILRSLGSDGFRGEPQHIDEIYAEFGLERGYHGDDHNPQHRWSIRHLGEHIYQYCTINGDFSSVELLLDNVLIEQTIQNGLDHIILWGTDQPDTVPWQFRRADTLWLAELMKGKICQRYSNIKVDVWTPVVAVNKTDEIRQEVEGFILEYALERLQEENTQAFTLFIQTKGSAPQIANSLEICAAALMRQCPVEQVIPVEPSPFFENGAVQVATEFHQISLGEYFWPLERERILSDWKRGDFTEASVWLEAHKDRYEIVYKLAKYLALAKNGEIKSSLLEIRNWCNSRIVNKQVEAARIQPWKIMLQPLVQKELTSPARFQLAWEETLFIDLALERSNYTIAFLKFSQVLERLFYVQAKNDNWVQKGYMVPPETYRGSLANMSHLGWEVYF
ncbi:MAG: hypothetical protein VKJ64_10575 [Leptolyngbyaceae bacterium]|nr:hypothetical protein [Leptolyngbyaceae bacterium]